jgi:hypothetical protein
MLGPFLNITNTFLKGVHLDYQLETPPDPPLR